MPKITVENAARQAFIPLMGELVGAYQAFAAYDAAGYSDVDLTVSQADVVFTLGNTPGLTFKEIGEKTLITKGTLTGVVDRMEKKGIVKRATDSEDRRSTRVMLSNKGKQLFEQEFPRQIAYLKKRFDKMTNQEQENLTKMLSDLRNIFM